MGILGPNGMGKSTALSILNGTLIPNLGDWRDTMPVWEEMTSILPKGELREYLTHVGEHGVRVSLKPQNVDRLEGLRWWWGSSWPAPITSERSRPDRSIGHRVHPRPDPVPPLSTG